MGFACLFSSSRKQFLHFQSKVVWGHQTLAILSGLIHSKMLTKPEIAFSILISPVHLHKETNDGWKHLFSTGISSDIIICSSEDNILGFTIVWGEKFKLVCAQEHKVILIKHCWMLYSLFQEPITVSFQLKVEFPASLMWDSKTGTILSSFLTTVSTIFCHL